MSIFKKSYQDMCDSLGSFASGVDGDKYINEVQSAIDHAVKDIHRIGNTDKGIHFIKGDVAEAWHAGTARIDSVVKGLRDVEIKVPRDTSPIDIKVHSSTADIKVQSKYYKTAEETAKQQSHPDYFGFTKIVPEEQLENIREIAYKLYLKNLETRPEQAQNYLDTFNRVTNVLKVGGAESRSASSEEMIKLGKFIKENKDFRDEFNLNTESFIKWEDILRESSEAAINAAILTAVLKAAPHLFKIIKSALQKGEVKREQIIDALKDISGSAASGGIRGAIAAGITSSCKSGLLGESLKTVNPSVVAGATVVAMNAAVNAFALYNGKITKQQFAECCLKDSFVVSVGIYGASVGQGLIPIPVLGAVIGNFVGSVLANVAYDSGKELVLGFFIESGYSFLGLVEQDYSIDRKILEQCGFDLIDLNYIELDFVELDLIELDRIEVDEIGIKLLKRGLIKVNTIGYI